MTRYESMETYLAIHNAVDQVAYLRDLKTSHDKLYSILAMNDCGKQSCEVCSSNREDLKAAEALR